VTDNRQVRHLTSESLLRRATDRLASMDLPWLFLNRPIKPFSFGLMGMMGVTAAEAFFADDTALGKSWVAGVLGVVALVSAVMLAAAWWNCRQRLMEIAMSIACGVWVGRLLLYVLETHPAWYRSGLAFFIAVMAAGAFFQEVRDSTPDHDPFGQPALKTTHDKIGNGADQ
jgi:hypothetical protein